MLHSKHRNTRSYKDHGRRVWIWAASCAILVVWIGAWILTSIPSQAPVIPLWGVPLYSSFSRNAVLQNINRQRILKLIKKKEGITFTALKNELGLQNGVLAYHLAMLEKNHYIKSFTDGKYKRFYSRKAQISGLTSAEEQIMKVIRSHPYITKRMLAKYIAYSPGTININIKKLMQKELIDLIKDGKRYRYYPKKFQDI